ncbi:MAG: hypothetical protein MI861_15205 [Pirellulales bacterium]|nr:hypothetical protein [Pirellulales bacterium]
MKRLRSRLVLEILEPRQMLAGDLALQSPVATSDSPSLVPDVPSEVAAADVQSVAGADEVVAEPAGSIADLAAAEFDASGLAEGPLALPQPPEPSDEIPDELQIAIPEPIDAGIAATDVLDAGEETGLPASLETRRTFNGLIGGADVQRDIRPPLIASGAEERMDRFPDSQNEEAPPANEETPDELKIDPESDT